MKRTLLIILPLIMIVECYGQRKDFYDLVYNENDGLMYLEDSDTPYTGRVEKKVINYNPGYKLKVGQSLPEITILKVRFKKGKLIDEYEFFDEDGKSKKPVNMKTLIYEGYDSNFNEITKNVTNLESIINVEHNIPFNIQYSNPNEQITHTYYGKVFYLDSDGKKILEGTLLNGRFVGLFKLWYESGQLKKTINFFNYQGSFYDGETKEFYSNGKVKSFENYKLSKLESDDGTIELGRTYSQEEMLEQEVGNWIEYNEDGEVLNERDFDYYYNLEEFLRDTWVIKDGYYIPDTSKCLSLLKYSNFFIFDNNLVELNDSTFKYNNQLLQKDDLNNKFIKRENDDSSFYFQDRPWKLKRYKNDFNVIKLDHLTLYRYQDKIDLLVDNSDSMFNEFVNDYPTTLSSVGSQIKQILTHIFNLKYKTKIPINSDVTIIDRNKKKLYEGSFSYGKNTGKNVFYDKDENIVLETFCLGLSGQISKNYLVENSPWIPQQSMVSMMWSREDIGFKSIEFYEDRIVLNYNNNEQKTYKVEFVDFTVGEDLYSGINIIGEKFNGLEYLSITYDSSLLTPTISINHPLFIKKNPLENNDVLYTFLESNLVHYLTQYVPQSVISWYSKIPNRMKN